MSAMLKGRLCSRAGYGSRAQALPQAMSGLHDVQQETRLLYPSRARPTTILVRISLNVMFNQSHIVLSKACHSKNFGTRDLRHANLPVAAPLADSESPSSPDKVSFTPQAFLRPLNTGAGARATSPTGLPRLRPNRSLATSPISPTFSRGSSPHQMCTFSAAADGAASSQAREAPADIDMVDEEAEVQDALVTDIIPSEHQDAATYPSNTGRPGIGTIPRTIPLSLNQTPATKRTHQTSLSVGAVPRHQIRDPPLKTSPELAEGGVGEEDEAEAADVAGVSTPQRFSHGVTSPAARHSTGNAGFGTYSVPSPSSVSPMQWTGTPAVKQTPTGTRYGATLGGGSGINGAGIGVQMTGTPRKWGAGTPQCPRCGKSVYFAEQVKAVGKTFHKHCLRCTECSTTLDSSRLRDHDGDPFCVRCYGKNYGPQGGGYALLGKAGG